MTAPVVMLDIAGTALDASDREWLAHPAVGGLILFARNFEDREQLRALTASIRAVRPDILIAVDQEGGRVQRFRRDFVRLPPMAALGRRYETAPDAALAEARLLGRLMADELVCCDVDISFAPVLDLDYGVSSVIGDRSFHSDAGTLTTLATAWIDGMAEAGMAATGKHFPGHGFVTADSHLELPRDERDLDTIRAADLKPFAALAPRLAGIMPAHVVYPAVAPEPAGFSPFWLQQVLRGELGFRGVIFSDDLTMQGAAATGDYAARTHAALSAGCDMVLVCNDRHAAAQVVEAVTAYAEDRVRVPASGLRARPTAPMPAALKAQAATVAASLCRDAEEL
ncbi:Beta-hexosaminidase [Isoalcanivorax pacificus W11-5]|uniref:Beta-hexosaminidase n=1 Tax=Isoalcanivorax pacificus W11-5 TaxID=391936 RepID=A0A0B4XQC8_9GAMM|nr:beta-N-acetylhexosaminidase [Isoalcanivorax pacificus]AJD48442.1 Beta-hexosaminidase [Isoalcanivorax pacificus W11-5]